MVCVIDFAEETLRANADQGVREASGDVVCDLTNDRTQENDTSVTTVVGDVFRSERHVRTLGNDLTPLAFSLRRIDVAKLCGALAGDDTAVDARQKALEVHIGPGGGKNGCAEAEPPGESGCIGDSAAQSPFGLVPFADQVLKGVADHKEVRRRHDEFGVSGVRRAPAE